MGRSQNGAHMCSGVQARLVSLFLMQLVVRKFEDPVGGDVNYPAFIQAIDVEYTGQTKQTEPVE